MHRCCKSGRARACVRATLMPRQTRAGTGRHGSETPTRAGRMTHENSAKNTIGTGVTGLSCAHARARVSISGEVYGNDP